MKYIPIGRFILTVLKQYFFVKRITGIKSALLCFLSLLTDNHGRKSDTDHLSHNWTRTWTWIIIIVTILVIMTLDREVKQMMSKFHEYSLWRQTGGGYFSLTVIIVFLSSLWTFSLVDEHHHWYYHVHPHDSLLVDWRRIRYLIFIDGQNINAVKWQILTDMSSSNLSGCLSPWSQKTRGSCQPPPWETTRQTSCWQGELSLFI